MKRTLIISAALIMAGGMISADAAETVSIERGRELFESAKLGTTGKSCATCHPGGKKLEWAATYDDERLGEISNKCIRKALQGKPLKEDSDDLKSLILYLKTFAGPN